MYDGEKPSKHFTPSRPLVGATAHATLLTFKRNVNAIVDVRLRRRLHRRRHEMIFLGNISETILASDFKMYRKVAPIVFTFQPEMTP